MHDTVTLRDVIAVLQPAELAVRIAEEIDSELAELGDDARLARLQLEELLDGVAPVRRLVVRDYMRAGPPVRAVSGPGAATDGARGGSRTGLEHALRALARLTTDELLDTRRVATALGLAPSHLDLDAALEPRGYRLLHRLPRFPEAVIDGIVEHFAGLQKIMRATVGELEEVDGSGRDPGQVGERRSGPVGRGHHSRSLRLIGVATATSTNAVETGAHQRGDPRGAVVVRPVE